MFTHFDKDMDGQVAVCELGALLRSMGRDYNPAMEEINQLIERHLPKGNLRPVQNLAILELSLPIQGLSRQKSQGIQRHFAVSQSGVHVRTI